MPGIAKINPAKIALGTLYSTLQLKAFKVNPSVAFASADLDGTATLFAQEMGTTGALFQVKSDGDYAIIIGDGHALDVDTLAMRIGRVHSGLSGTVSGGVFTASDSSTVTVTQLTSLFAV
jgi:hypothetical protein